MTDLSLSSNKKQKLCKHCKKHRLICKFKSIKSYWCIDCSYAYRKEYISKNREKLNTYHRELRKNNPTVRIAHNLRTRLSKALQGIVKTGSVVDNLGCTVKELKVHIELKFKEGMSWDNYGSWHLDHIKPLSSYDLSNTSELKKACHFSNLQPLWASENWSKSDKLVG